MKDWDVIIVGGGNAAYCAALAAREEGASVLSTLPAPPATARAARAYAVLTKGAT